MTWSAWLIMSVVLLVVEILTPGTFFFACLSMGALVAGISATAAVPGWLPWIVFAVISLVSIYLIRPFAKRMFQQHRKKSNVDALIGEKAWVTEPINPPDNGMVKVEGELWRAEASEKIEAGVYVEVKSVKGTRLEVQRVQSSV